MKQLSHKHFVKPNIFVMKNYSIDYSHFSSLEFQQFFNQQYSRFLKSPSKRGRERILRMYSTMNEKRNSEGLPKLTLPNLEYYA